MPLCNHCNNPIRKFSKRNDFNGRMLHLQCWKLLENVENFKARMALN